LGFDDLDLVGGGSIEVKDYDGMSSRPNKRNLAGVELSEERQLGNAP